MNRGPAPELNPDRSEPKPQIRAGHATMVCMIPEDIAKADIDRVLFGALHREAEQGRAGPEFDHHVGGRLNDGKANDAKSPRPDSLPDRHPIACCSHVFRDSNSWPNSHSLSAVPLALGGALFAVINLLPPKSPGHILDEH